VTVIHQAFWYAITVWITVVAAFFVLTLVDGFLVFFIHRRGGTTTTGPLFPVIGFLHLCLTAPFLWPLAAVKGLWRKIFKSKGN
jgi:hypothetical protein